MKVNTRCAFFSPPSSRSLKRKETLGTKLLTSLNYLLVMTESEDKSKCGIPQWLPIPHNDTASFANDVVLCAVNVPFCVFAFLGNLAVIVAVIKTPSLQRPCNILLCGLATTDCLTGLIAQPIFIAWRLMIHRIHESCDHQAEMLQAFLVSQSAFVGWSFVNITLISFDRHYALAKPMVYRTSMTRTSNNLHMDYFFNKIVKYLIVELIT